MASETICIVDCQNQTNKTEMFKILGCVEYSLLKPNALTFSCAVKDATDLQAQPVQAILMIHGAG